MMNSINEIEIQLIDKCLTHIYDYPAPRDLEPLFHSHANGTYQRIQTLMESEGLIELSVGMRIGSKKATITNKGNRIIVTHGSFTKYLQAEQERKNEIKKKQAATEAREERNTIANEKNAKSSKMIVFLTTLTVVISAIAVWQTQKNNEKDRVIEIQTKHIQQLQGKNKHQRSGYTKALNYSMLLQSFIVIVT